MSSSGRVFDLYDDKKGEVFVGLYPTPDAIPDFIKQAHPLTSEERECLPDDLFALVMIDGDQKYRKFACVDAGNTALNLAYLEKSASALPVEAQQVAALNLIKAAEWYGVEVPEGVLKLAGVIGNAKGALGTVKGLATGAGEAIASPLRTLDLIRHPVESFKKSPIDTTMTAMMAPGYIHQIGSQTAPRAQAARAAGGNMLSPEQMREMELQFKGGEAGALMTNQKATEKDPAKAVIPKSASVGRLVTGHSAHADAAATELEQGKPISGEQAKSLPQSKALHPHVVVSGGSKKTSSVKEVSRYALGDKYPLDSYQEVKIAAAYFNEYSIRFTPEERHEYCQNLVKRAEELNIRLDRDIRKYGSSAYAPDNEIQVAMDSRRLILSDEKLAAVLTELEGCRSVLAPEAFCAALEEFDKMASIHYFYDGDVVDPYYSTFGFDKTAEDYSYNEGNDYITGEQLEVFGKVRHKQLVTSFGDEFAEEFRKDPVGIFKSMPRDQKRMILHMAVDNSPGSDVVP